MSLLIPRWLAISSTESQGSGLGVIRFLQPGQIGPDWIGLEAVGVRSLGASTTWRTEANSEGRKCSTGQPVSTGVARGAGVEGSTGDGLAVQSLKQASQSDGLGVGCGFGFEGR